jgi:hypothetical protein
MHFAGVNSDSVRKDGNTVSLGEVRLTARLTPGHTRHYDPDDYRRRRRLLLPGCVSRRRVGRTNKKQDKQEKEELSFGSRDSHFDLQKVVRVGAGRPRFA